MKKRTRWAINYVIDVKKLSNEKLALEMGVNIGTINNYRTMRTEPRLAFIERFCKLYGFNYEWLMFGIEGPFPGAREKYPEICGPPSFQDVTKSSSSPGPEMPMSSLLGGDGMLGFRVSDDITMAARILESKSQYATALHLNIVAFDRAVLAEQRISQLETRITSAEDQFRHEMDELTARIQELETRNEELEASTPPPDKPTRLPDGENPETS